MTGSALGGMAIRFASALALLLVGELLALLGVGPMNLWLMATGGVLIACGVTLLVIIVIRRNHAQDRNG